LRKFLFYAWGYVIRKMLGTGLPYRVLVKSNECVLAYQSKNFGQILGNIFSIRLIRGSVFSSKQVNTKYMLRLSTSILGLIWSRVLWPPQFICFTLTYTRVDLYATYLKSINSTFLQYQIINHDLVVTRLEKKLKTTAL